VFIPSRLSSLTVPVAERCAIKEKKMDVIVMGEELSGSMGEELSAPSELG
jgi:hypothetical protein